MADARIATQLPTITRREDYRAPDWHVPEIALDVEVWDLRQLNQLLTQLKDLDCVSTVKRVYD